MFRIAVTPAVFDAIGDRQVMGQMRRLLTMATVAFLLAGCSQDFFVPPPLPQGPVLHPTQAQVNAAHGEYTVTPPPY
jgi:hypothetical protein